MGWTWKVRATIGTDFPSSIACDSLLKLEGFLKRETKPHEDLWPEALGPIGGGPGDGVRQALRVHRDMPLTPETDLPAS